MPASNVNRTIITGNLTRDPELKDVSGGVKVCSMRVAVNGRVKRDGEWVDKPNFFNVTAFGAQAENCHRYLAKGRPVAVDGRLDWHEWEQDGVRRESVQVIAETVQFLDDGRDRSDSGSGSSTSGDAPPPVSAAPADDDIPF